VYNSEALARIEASYRDAVERLAAAVLPDADRQLWRSRIEYMVARGYQALENKVASVAYYESGLAALEVLKPDRISSESWRMTSECISQLCLLKGTGYIVANGPKVSSYAEKALALNPGNAAARVIIAAGKVYPPAMFGGNPKRGIELMQEALALGTAERDDLFNIYLGIGLAYGKLKNTAEARRWLAMALELYPGSVYARTEYEKLGKG
jgi:tetratricopeptide (TPR) repeat protein